MPNHLWRGNEVCAVSQLFINMYPIFTLKAFRDELLGLYLFTSKWNFFMFVALRLSW